MDIKLTHKKVEALSIRSVVDGELDQEKEFHINIGSTIYSHKSKKNIVRIRYPVTFNVKDKVSVSMDYDFYFALSEEVTEEFNDSVTAKKDAPAIAFPYIKIYLDNVLAMSGYKDIEVPFIDFNKDPFEFDK